MTDEASQYQGIGAGKVFEAHGWTNHSAGDAQRADIALQFVKGRRLTYNPTH